MSRWLSLVFVTTTIAATDCGRFKKSAPSGSDASFDNTSHVSMSAEATGTSAFELTGPAFAKLDEASGRLAITIEAPTNVPAPSCDVFERASSEAPIRSGAVATLSILGISAAKPGNYPLIGASFAKADPLDGEPQAGDFSMRGSVVDSATIRISQIDSASLVAEVPDAKTGKPFASIRATMCKPGSLAPMRSPDGGEATAGERTPGEVSRPNFIDMDLPEGETQKTGSVLALVKLDPKAKLLVIYVWDFTLTPRPTCATFSTAPDAAVYGAFAMVTVANYPERKTGTFSVSSARFFTRDVAPPRATSGASKLDATTIDITDYDDVIFTATITSSAGAKAKITGKIDSPVCPDGPIHLPKGRSSGGKSHF